MAEQAKGSTPQYRKPMCPLVVHRLEKVMPALLRNRLEANAKAISAPAYV